MLSRGQAMNALMTEALRIMVMGCGRRWARSGRTASARKENRYRYAELEQERVLFWPLLPRTIGAQGEFAETSSIADEQHRILIARTINIPGKR